MLKLSEDVEVRLKLDQEATENMNAGTGNWWTLLFAAACQMQANP
jgi:hypothetical protein